MKKVYWGSIIFLFAFTAMLNVLAWNSSYFSDWYIINIFPIWGLTYGRLTELSSISVGEIMIAVAISLVFFVPVIWLVAVFFSRIRKSARTYSKFVLGIAAVTSLVMTLNCFILYHASDFEDKYLNDYLLEEREYTISELGELRDMVVERANLLAKLVERDENGYIIYDKNIGQEAVKAMERLGEEYPQLAGHYTVPKTFAASEFFSQQYMEGYYFPFSMEANYNDVMYIVNKPAVICHELAHTKGFIYEDEANLIGFLACIHSEDPFFQYSGYLSVLTYIDRDFKESIDNNKDVYASHVKISTNVKRDNVFLTPEAWAKVESKAVISTKTVSKVSHEFLEANLNLNGIEQGTANYSEVVGLLMDYYICNIDENVSRDVYLASKE